MTLRQGRAKGGAVQDAKGICLRGAGLKSPCLDGQAQAWEVPSQSIMGVCVLEDPLHRPDQAL